MGGLKPPGLNPRHKNGGVLNRPHLTLDTRMGVLNPPHLTLDTRMGVLNPPHLTLDTRMGVLNLCLGAFVTTVLG